MLLGPHLHLRRLTDILLLYQQFHPPPAPPLPPPPPHPPARPRRLHRHRHHRHQHQYHPVTCMPIAESHLYSPRKMLPRVPQPPDSRLYSIVRSSLHKAGNHSSSRPGGPVPSRECNRGEVFAVSCICVWLRIWGALEQSRIRGLELS